MMTTVMTTDNRMINGAKLNQVDFPSLRDGDSDSNENNNSSNNKLLSILDRVRKISNFASFLCVLDCTLVSYDIFRSEYDMI